jgi:hypothetical protein
MSKPSNIATFSCSADLMVPEKEYPIDLLTLTDLIEFFPLSSSCVFFNTVFLTNSFVFCLNGEWCFYNDNNKTIDTWDWTKYIRIICDDYGDDVDGINDFNSGWSFFVSSHFPNYSEDVIRSFVNFDYSDLYIVRMESLGQQNHESVIKHRISDILNENVPEQEKINKIYSLFKQ